MSKKLPENLVALVYADNCCYCKVTDNAMAEIIVDAENGTWTHKGAPPFKLNRIGYYDPSMKQRSSGVIGVYNKLNIHHLENMVRNWHDIRDEDRSFDD